MLKISIVCGNVNINFTQKTCLTVNSLMMVLQDRSKWELARDTKYIHLCIAMWCVKLENHVTLFCFSHVLQLYINI
jgi:hypothetical protein